MPTHIANPHSTPAAIDKPTQPLDTAPTNTRQKPTNPTDQRGRGVGRALVAQAERWARAQGCREMASDTTPDYPLSPAAHRALGYDEVGRQEVDGLLEIYFRKAL